MYLNVDEYLVELGEASFEFLVSGDQGVNLLYTVTHKCVQQILPGTF